MSDIFGDKIKLIEKATQQLDDRLISLSGQISKVLIEQFIDQLETDKGVIKNNSYNLRLVTLIDNLYQELMLKQGGKVAGEIVNNVDKILKANVDYYSEYAGKGYEKSSKKVKQIIDDRLGVGNKVQLKRGGYLDSLLSDTKVQNDIKKLSYQEIIKGAGFKNFKRSMELFIKGDEDRLGAFRQHYRQYIYDIYVQVDRDQSLLLAEELDLRYFVYEGTLIATSRKFCRARAGKVFSVEEAKAWVDDPWVQTNLEKGYISSYNPTTDMGLFGCRHLPRFVTKETALMMRPELEQ